MKKRNPVARNCPRKGGAHLDRKKESKKNPPKNIHSYDGFVLEQTGANRFRLHLKH